MATKDEEHCGVCSLNDFQVRSESETRDLRADAVRGGGGQECSTGMGCPVSPSNSYSYLCLASENVE